MPARVRIRPEIITEHRMRMEMMDLEDEDIENTIRMKGWAWVLARRSWVYAGEPDFVFRQIREVIIGLPDIIFDSKTIEESIRTVEKKARNPEERQEGRSLLQRALKSEAVQLREFEGQRVRINASLVEDYVPDEGDPKLLDVFSITSLQQD